MSETSKNNLIVKPNPGFQQCFASSSVDCVFGGGVLAGGKAILLSELVLTPNGYKPLYDIVEGDTVVDPSTGGTQIITQLHPIEKHPYFRIHFEDKTYIDCSEGHLWKARKGSKKWEIIETGKLYAWYQSASGRKYPYPYNIPLCAPVTFDSGYDISEGIDPYILGNLLGNGCFSAHYMYNLRRVSLATPFDEVVAKFSEMGYDMTHFEDRGGCKIYSIYSKELRKQLEDLGLACHTAPDKFIPDAYKYSSIYNRKRLICGLIDSDGYIDERGRMGYTTISKRLADDVAFVARSLGCWVSLREESGHKYECQGETRYGQTLYSLRISSPFPEELVSVKKRAERIRPRKKSMTKVIKKIEYIGVQEGRCITVSGKEGLFITNDFTVTHNSFGLVLAMAEPLMTDPDFRGLISRRALGSIKAAGGFSDKFKTIFGDMCSVKQSDSPRVSFASGAFCDLTYIDDTNLDKLRERARGWEYDMIAIDELTEMTWEAFSYLQTRNRGRSKTFTGKFFATMNPKRSHWTRVFLDWYIGVDGFIIPERDGCVRYFYINGNTVNDVVWGDTKEEVYRKCKVQIDRTLSRTGGNFTYENMIKSFVFYKGALSENSALIEGNPDYVGSVAASGGKQGQALLEGNWNVDPDEDEHIPIPSDKARGIFENDPCTNGDKWITVDLADYGTDNLVALAWNGFHAYDILVLMKSTPRENASAVRAFAREHGVAENHIIYDATSGRYFNDYVPDAIPYISNRKPYGMYALTAMTLKDMCYLRLCKMIENGQFTFDERLAVRNYTHQNLKFCVSVENELLEELSVVRFDIMQSGKKKLWNKKKMNEMLGKGRSMDLADPCAMRMLPCAEFEYGDELGAGRYREEEPEEFVGDSIFDETLWY